MTSTTVEARVERLRQLRDEVVASGLAASESIRRAHQEKVEQAISQLCDAQIALCCARNTLFEARGHVQRIASDAAATLLREYEEQAAQYEQQLAQAHANLRAAIAAQVTAAAALALSDATLQ